MQEDFIINCRDIQKVFLLPHMVLLKLQKDSHSLSLSHHLSISQVCQVSLLICHPPLTMILPHSLPHQLSLSLQLVHQHSSSHCLLHQQLTSLHFLHQQSASFHLLHQQLTSLHFLHQQSASLHLLHQQLISLHFLHQQSASLHLLHQQLTSLYSASFGISA